MVRTFYLLLFCLMWCLTASAQNLTPGIAAFENGELEQAEEFFSNILKSDKKHPAANFYMGRIYFDREEFGDATDWFEEAAKYDDDNSVYFMWLGHGYGRQAQNASVLRQAGLGRKCRINYEKAVEMDPSNIEARESIMDFYMQAPGFMGGGRDKAEDQANHISALDPVAGFMAKASIHNYYGETDQAMEIFHQAVETYPEAMPPYYRLFNIYFNRQEFEKAAEIARKQLAVNDTSAVIYFNLGNALQRFNQFEEAYTAYQQGMEVDSALNNFWYQMGRLADESGTHLEEGKEYILRYLEEPNLGDVIKAWSYYRLGSIHEQLGEMVEARKAYETALGIDKDHEPAKEAIGRLR